jgi:putative SOS response-associated peptidase YedK
MCNLYSQTRSVDEVASCFRALQMPLSFPEGIPNLQPRDVSITDPAPIVRLGPDGFEMVVRRWSWPGPTGKPVYNFRSDNREFPSGRVLIIADGFYEFTKPADPKQKRKDRWLFTDPATALIGIAGLIGEVPGIGEAFTMLLPSMAPTYHRITAAKWPFCPQASGEDGWITRLQLLNCLGLLGPEH